MPAGWAQYYDQLVRIRRRLTFNNKQSRARRDAGLARGTLTLYAEQAQRYLTALRRTESVRALLGQIEEAAVEKGAAVQPLIAEVRSFLRRSRKWSQWIA